MFSIRSKVQNTPIPSYTTFNRRRPSSNDRDRSHSNDDNHNRSSNSIYSFKASTIKKRRKKKRRASEVVNINDYPSAKRFMFVFLSLCFIVTVYKKKNKKKTYKLKICDIK